MSNKRKEYMKEYMRNKRKKHFKRQESTRRKAYNKKYGQANLNKVKESPKKPNLEKRLLNCTDA